MESPWELKLEHSHMDVIPEALKHIKITKDMTIGRCPESNLIIPTPYMSRRTCHCKVFLRDGALYVHSFASLNPTFINMEGMAANSDQRLYEGDRIGLGIASTVTPSAYVYAVHRAEPIIKEEYDDVVIISDSEEESPTIHFPSPALNVSISSLAGAIPRPFPSYSPIKKPSPTVGPGPINAVTSPPSDVMTTNAVKGLSSTIPMRDTVPSSVVKGPSSVIKSTVNIPISSKNTISIASGPTSEVQSGSAGPSSAYNIPVVPFAEPLSSDEDDILSSSDSVNSDSAVEQHDAALIVNNQLGSETRLVKGSVVCNSNSQETKNRMQPSTSTEANYQESTSTGTAKQRSGLSREGRNKSKKEKKTATNMTSAIITKPFNFFGDSSDDDIVSNGHEKLKNNDKPSSIKFASSSSESKTLEKEKSTKNHQKAGYSKSTKDKREEESSKKKKKSSEKTKKLESKVSAQGHTTKSIANEGKQVPTPTKEEVVPKRRSTDNVTSRHSSPSSSKAGSDHGLKVTKEKERGLPKKKLPENTKLSTNSSKSTKDAGNNAAESSRENKKSKQKFVLEKFYVKECSVVLKNLSQEEVEQFTNPSSSQPGAGKILTSSKRYRIPSSSSEEDTRTSNKSREKSHAKLSKKSKFSRIRFAISSDSSSEDSPEDLQVPNKSSITSSKSKLNTDNKSRLLSPEKLKSRSPNSDFHSTGSFRQSSSSSKEEKKTKDGKNVSSENVPASTSFESSKKKRGEASRNIEKQHEKTLKDDHSSKKEKSSRKRSAEKRKSTDQPASSSDSKKIKLDKEKPVELSPKKIIKPIADETNEFPPDEDEHFLADFETVYVKPEAEWDFSQYTQDDEIVVLDVFNDTKSHEKSISNSLQNESKKHIPKQASDVPFDNEFSWLVNSQNENILETEKKQKDLKEILEKSSSSDDEIFETRKPFALTSTPKVKPHIKSVKSHEDEELEIISTSPTFAVDKVSDSPSEPESSDIETPANVQEASMSDTSSDNEFVESKEQGSEDEIFEKEKRKDKIKKTTPVLINALPCKPRKQGRPPGLATASTSRLDEVDNVKSISSRKKKEEKKQVAIKPKAFYSDKIRKLNGQKVKNSKWIPDHNAGDKEAHKALKAERMKRLKNLEMKKPVDAESVAPSTSTHSAMDAPNIAQENTETVNSRMDPSKVQIKVTKHNRGTFLTEDLPAGKKTPRELDQTSPEKVFLSQSKVIVIGPEKSNKTSDTSSIAAKKKSKDSKQTSAGDVPGPSQKSGSIVKEQISKKSDKTKKSLSKCKNIPTEVPADLSMKKSEQQKSSSKSKENNEILGGIEKVSSIAKPQRDLSKTVVEELSVKENQIASHSTDTSSSSARETQVVSAPSTSNGHHTSLLKAPNKDRKAPKKRVRFNDDIVINEFDITEGNVLHPVNNSSKTMTRHPLPDVKESAVEEEMHRVILSMLNWGTQWRNVELTLCFPPPVWKKDNILYTKTELLQLRKEGMSTKQLRPDKDPVEERLNLPPKACTIKFPSFQAYHKEWYRLLLLELWATLSRSPPTPVGKLYASVVGWDDTEGLSRSKVMKLTVPVCRDTLIAEPPSAGNFVMLELIPPSENSQAREEQNVYRTFGYVEKDRMLEASSAVQKMHPETGKPVIKNIEIEILVKYREWDLQDYTATIETLTHAKTGLKNMQGLFELASSPLKDIILAPSLRNMTAPPMQVDKIKFTVASLMSSLPLSPEQESIAEKIANTLMNEDPSVSVLEGPAGCGKTRVLLAVVMCLLHEHLVSPRSSQSRGRRVLVCLTNVESVNAFTFKLNLLRDSLRGTRNKFNFVTIGPKDQLHGAASKYSLQMADIDKGPMICEETMLIEDMMESDKNILEANVNSLKLKLEHVMSKSSHDAKLLQSALNDTEERLRQLTLGVDKSQSELMKKARMERRQKEMLRNSEVIITTLSQGLTVGPMISNFGPGKFAHTPICLIDDAHRAAEVQCLMPLMLGTSKMVLAGDLALPEASMQSRFASNLGLRNSLLQRITRALDMSHIEARQPNHQSSPVPLSKTKGTLPGLTYHRLTQQYRMCPRLTSLAVTNLGLDTLPPPPDPRWSMLPLRSYLVFDHSFLQPGPMSEFARSCWLHQEARFAVQLARSLRQHIDPKKAFNTMILVPDEEYGSYVQKYLNLYGSRDSDHPNYWHTVLDLSIGMDAQVVIACLGDGRSPFHDPKQLTLALTRAKNSFIVVGHLNTFKCRPHWLKMFRSAERYGALMTVDENTPESAIVTHMFLDEEAPYSPRSWSPASDMELDANGEVV